MQPASIERGFLGGFLVSPGALMRVMNGLRACFLAAVMLFGVSAQAVSDAVVRIPRPIDSVLRLAQLYISVGVWFGNQWLPNDLVGYILEYVPRPTTSFLKVFSPFVRDLAGHKSAALEVFDSIASRELVLYIADRQAMHRRLSSQKRALAAGLVAVVALGAGVGWILHEDDIPSWWGFTIINVVCVAPAVNLPFALYRYWREPRKYLEVGIWLGWLSHLQRKYEN